MDTKYGSALKTRLRIRSGLEMATMMHSSTHVSGDRRRTQRVGHNAVPDPVPWNVDPLCYICTIPLTRPHTLLRTDHQPCSPV